MKIIVGLGNPGARYEFTRHNIGFLAVDYIADKFNISLNKKNHKAIWGRREGVNNIIIAKPQTFMNLSGEAVKSLAVFFCIEPEGILVIYDDVDLTFGSIRIRKKGGGGGHKGVESIIEKLGTNGFPRIRLGIGRPKEKGQGARRVPSGRGQVDVVEYVLSQFNPDEEDVLKQTLDRTKEAVDTILKDSIEKAMNEFNRPKTEDQRPKTKT